MENTIHWEIFEEQLGKRVANCEYLLNKAIAEQEIRKEILKHKSQTAYKAFKQFLREVDKAPITDNQRLDVIKHFNVSEHL